MTNQSNTRQKRLAKIHIGRQALGMDDDVYRAMLRRVTGKTSCARMDDWELKRVLDELARLGFGHTLGQAPLRRSDAAPMMRKIAALLNETGKNQMLARLGISRQQALNAVLADDEVEACREDLRGAMLAQAWRLYGEGLSQDDADRLWRVVRRWQPVLAETVLTAKLNGYAVAQYVYTQEEDGFINITQVHNRSGSLKTVFETVRRLPESRFGL